MPKHSVRWSMIAFSNGCMAFSLLLGMLSMAPTKPASALTINRNFTGGAAPVTAAGGGSIVDIFNTAADWWEASILDSHSVDVDFGWADLPGSVLGTASTADAIRITSGTIQFDNTGTNWFLDASPTENSEYQAFTETSQDLGGGIVNTSREFSASFGDAFGRFDLLTVAAHEIGHLLGIIDLFGNPMPNPLLITGPRPHAGTTIDTVAFGGGHLSNISYPSTLMNPFVAPSVRRTQSAIDILVAAERSNFVDLNLDPLAEPITVAEPASLVVATFGPFCNVCSSSPQAISLLRQGEWKTTLPLSPPLVLNVGGLSPNATFAAAHLEGLAILVMEKALHVSLSDACRDQPPSWLQMDRLILAFEVGLKWRARSIWIKIGFLANLYYISVKYLLLSPVGSQR